MIGSPWRKRVTIQLTSNVSALLIFIEYSKSFCPYPILLLGYWSLSPSSFLLDFHSMLSLQLGFSAPKIALNLERKWSRLCILWEQREKLISAGKKWFFLMYFSIQFLERFEENGQSPNKWISKLITPLFVGQEL